MGGLVTLPRLDVAVRDQSIPGDDGAGILLTIGIAWGDTQPAVVGDDGRQEEVQYKVFRSLGLNDTAIRSWFNGPVTHLDLRVPSIRQPRSPQQSATPVAVQSVRQSVWDIADEGSLKRMCSAVPTHV